MFFFFKKKKQVWLIFILNCLIISFKLLWSLCALKYSWGCFSPFRVWQTITLCWEWGVNWIREAGQVELRDMVSKSQFPREEDSSASLPFMFLCFCFCCGLVWGKKKREREEEEETVDPDVKCVFQNWCRCACVLYMCAFVCGGYTRGSMYDQKVVELNASMMTPQISKSRRKIRVNKAPFQESSYSSVTLRTALEDFQF